MGVALYCGRLLFRTYTRVLIADGIVWEYVGGNNSRILQKGLLIMGPGGIELADHGEYIVGMCHYGDTCKASWFVINKISGAIVEDDHLYYTEGSDPFDIRKVSSARRSAADTPTDISNASSALA